MRRDAGVPADAARDPAVDRRVGAGELSWRVRVDPPLPGAVNMAWDHTLALEAPADVGILRLYEWARPTLSLGRHEPARGIYDPGKLDRRGVDVVRRPTGGRAVLHHRELTYAVIAPIRPLGGVRAAYRTLNRALATGLARLGAPVTLASNGPVAAPDAGPCFREPAPGEVMAAGRKLVGSAQVRFGDRLLQHGSILLHDDQGLLEELLCAAAHGSDADRYGPGSHGQDREDRPATLAGLLPSVPSVAAVRDAVVQGFREACAGDWRGPGGKDSFRPDDIPGGPRPDLLERYESREWTWRR